MHYQVLGPLSASVDGESVNLGGPKQRLVLALLLMEAGRTVSADRLIDRVWDDDPPEQARHTLQAYISELRKSLDDPIEWTGSAYRLVVDSDQIDSVRFERLLEAGRRLLDSDPSQAALMLKEALDLWAGRPYEDLDYASGTRTEISRLEELRLVALESRLDCDLRLGRQIETVAELESLTAEYPLRETFRAQQMLALYRLGRQAEALRTFDRLRRTLAEELGIDPSPALQLLEQRILDQDPSLNLEPDMEPVLSTNGSGATTIRGYELRDRIGEGALGVVYRAYQTSVGREVAIKVIHPEHSNQPHFVKRFEAEAQFIAGLDHLHLVSLHDYWRDPDGAYLVMPYLRGGSLARALERGPFNAGPAMRLLEQVGAALSYAHRKLVTHGDIKPANVLFDDEGNAYLSDFSIAAHATDNAETDLYQFALLSYQLFSGTLPPSLGGLPSMSAIRPDLPIELSRVLQLATSEQATMRPDRVEDFLRLVRQAIGADVVGAVFDTAPSSAPLRNPYKGLRAFQETDAPDFHGREGLLDELLEALRLHRVVAVVGPSGSGKSSVVRAALLPALRVGALSDSQEWLITDMFPGSYPFEELEAALLRVAVDEPGALLDELRSDDRGLMRIIKRILPTDDSQLILVIDQFEEMFSMVDDEETRNLFLGALTTLVNDERGRVRVVLTLRADFFDRPLQYASFGQLVKDGLVPVIPPTDEGLSLAISRPARGVGLDLEAGLVGEIVNDVHGQPGGLPLLQYALTEMFVQRKSSVLTIDGYRQTGGVLGALGRRAEEIFTGLPAAGQEAAQQLFLRLVTVDEEADDTRRRVRLSELRGLDTDQATVEIVLQQYAAYRLLTFDRDPLTRSPTVEVAHEALLRGWERLRGWINEQREELLLHRRLAAAQHEWEQADEGAAFLLAGGRLEQFETWAKDSGMSLTGAERRYLATSRVEEDRRVRRRTIRRWSIVGVLAAATVVIGLLALTANDQARLATVRELSAASIAKVEAEPELAILLALHAAETSRSAGEPALPETLDALHRAVQASRIVGRIPGNLFVEYSPNGELMVVASGSDAAIWNVAREEMIRVLASPGGQAGGAAFSADGSLLAVGYTGGEAAVVLWDVATGERLSQMRGPMWSFSPIRVAFSPDVGLVAAAGPEGFPAFVWNVADGSERYQIGTDAADVDFAPDGSTLAVADYERGVTLNDPETGAETDFIEETDFNPVGIAFDPSGTRLAAVQQPGQEARIFDVDAQEIITSISIQSPTDLDWSPDGRWLALVSVAGNPRLYDTETWNEEMVLPGPSSAWLAFSPDGRQLASAGESDTLVWDVTPAGNREVRTLHLPDLSPDVAMLGTGVDEILVARDVCPPLCPATFGGTHLSRGPVALIDASGQQIAEGPVAFVTWPLAASSKAGLLGIIDPKCSGQIIDTGTLEPAFDLPAGMYAKAISSDGTRALLSLISPECPAEYTQPTVVEYPSGRLLARLPGGPVDRAYLSPDGQLAVATPYDTFKTYLYDIEAGQVLFTFDSEYFVFAFNPDGQQLAATATDGTLTVFDVATLRAGGSEGQGLIWSIAAHVVIIPFVQYTPDGSAIVTVGRNDSLIRVWDPATGERIAEFVTDRDAERLPFFDISSDSRHIIALGGDDTLRVYTLDTDELIQIAKDRVTRSFTEDECRAYLHVESCPES